MRTAKLPVDVGDVYQPSTASSPGPVHTGSGARAWLTQCAAGCGAGACDEGARRGAEPAPRDDPAPPRHPAVRAHRPHPPHQVRPRMLVYTLLNLPLVMTLLHHATLLFARAAPILRTKRPLPGSTIPKVLSSTRAISLDATQLKDARRARVQGGKLQRSVNVILPLTGSSSVRTSDPSPPIATPVSP
eukprot:1185842-Prorocentrum_minimum.AAC.2